MIPISTAPSMATARRSRGTMPWRPVAECGDCSFSVSVVLPCLNEEAAVVAVVEAAWRGLASAGVTAGAAEVLVVDNGSHDAGPPRAAAAGARVIHEPRPGYGAALGAGVRAARGEVVVLADADGSYDLARLGELLAPLASGADLVVGGRLHGEIAPGAMPPLHRYLGTPLLGRLLGLAGGAAVGDSQSGFRAARRDTLLGLDLRASGMEYASEMLLRAGRARLVVAEIPTPYRSRLGESKLRPLRDGWRHVRLLLFLSPHLTLIGPGLVLAVVGLLLCAMSLVAPIGLAIAVGEGMRWLPVFLGPMCMILGAQALLLGALATYRRPPMGSPDRFPFLGVGTCFVRPGAISRLLTGYALLTVAGAVIDGALFVLWLLDRSGPALIGIAGLAQALIVVGLGGIATLFALAE